MTAENREVEEASNITEDCIQAMESMLRQEFDYASVSQLPDDVIIKRMAMKGYDWCNKNMPSYIDKIDFYFLAKEALERYKKNWKDKEQGEDNRGKRLGKSSQKVI